MFPDPARALLDSLLGRGHAADPRASDGGMAGILRNMQTANTYNQSLSQPLASYPNYRAPQRMSPGPSVSPPGVTTDDYIYGTSPDGDAAWRAREQAGWRAEADLNSLPTSPPPFDTDALAASYRGDPMTAGEPSWMQPDEQIALPDYPTSPSRLPTWVGEVDQTYKPASSFVAGKSAGLARLPQQGWIAPRGASPDEAAADHADSMRAKAAIQQGEMALADALRGNAERDARERMDRNIGQASPLSNSEWLMSSGGPGFARSGRGPGGGAYEREFAGPATQRVGLVRDDGFEFDPTPKPSFIDRSSNVSRSGYVSYKQSRDAQRQRLADRGLAPERIAQLMGGPRPGPDMSVMRAVNQSNMQAGINPRLSQALALDAAGGALQGGSTMALRDSLLGVPGANSIQDQIAMERWGLEKPLLQARAEKEAAAIADPSTALADEIKQQNARDEAAARGMAGNITINPLTNEPGLLVASNDYMSGKPMSPQIDRALRNDLSSNAYDPKAWFVPGGWTTAGKKAAFVKYATGKYPGLTPEAATKWYEENALQESGVDTGLRQWGIIDDISSGGGQLRPNWAK